MKSLFEIGLSNDRYTGLIHKLNGYSFRWKISHLLVANSRELGERRLDQQ